MAPLLQSATTPSDGDAIVTVRGDIDTTTAGQLWQYLSYLVGQGHHHIVLDLGGMILIDSAGVEVLARVSASMSPRTVTMASPSDEVVADCNSGAMRPPYPGTTPTG